MSLKTNTKGFTIVELLIVIVVIGILAAITIVAFNGIQSRSKSAASQSLANSVVKKAEAWNSIQGTYPTFCQLTTNRTDSTGTTTCSAGTAANTGPAEARLDNASSVAVGPIADAAASNNGKVVGYAGGGGSTATVTWWKFDGTAATQTISLGS